MRVRVAIGVDAKGPEVPRGVEGTGDGSLGGVDTELTIDLSDPSAFYRAFRRWTGKTPVEYREAGLSSPAPRA